MTVYFEKHMLKLHITPEEKKWFKKEIIIAILVDDQLISGNLN